MSPPIELKEIKSNAERPPRSIIKPGTMDIVKRKLPIIQWLPTYTLSFFMQDLLAGFTVSLTEIPQGIAYAIVAGLATQYGMYSCIMGGCMYVIFGTCKDINMGPTAILALFIQSSVATMGPDAAALISFLTGLLIFLAGVLHLGFVVEFFSYPVITGFTTAAALSIACSQLKGLLGIKGSANEFLEAWKTVIEHISETRKWDATLGFVSIAFLFVFRYIRKYGSLKTNPEWSSGRNISAIVIMYFSLGSNALAVIAGTSIAYVAEKHYNATPFLLTGPVQEGFPPISFPPFSTTWNGTFFSFTDMVSEYGSLVAFCPMVAFLEHIAIVKAFSKGKTIDATQELLALGIGNMAGSLIHSMPITGSFTRTAVNNASGVRTTVGGLITSLMLLVSLAVLTGVFQYIPKATLAAVVMVSMYYLCEFHAIGVMWKTKRLDLIPYFLTVLCSLFISLEYGILIGIGASMVYILYDSARPKLYMERLVILDRVVYLIRPKVGLYFTSAEFFREKLLTECSEEKSIVAIDGQYIRTTDSTGAKNLLDLHDNLKVRNQILVLWNFKDSVKQICIGDSKKLTNNFHSGELEDIVNDL
ncbi:hypothetical protein GWI33_008702 [Rhynchophorus ferrugineus]|uniref:STAS domain-containing protein n=1 Tax=Rhynchophorus ferrugineus TaxID=354439 RepID=A0A834IGE2_RHYFE|nr:hypothetical protein GWI33_008702 [Rhynchophorus ferrugineus]